MFCNSLNCSGTFWNKNVLEKQKSFFKAFTGVVFDILRSFFAATVLVLETENSLEFLTKFY